MFEVTEKFSVEPAAVNGYIRCAALRGLELVEGSVTERSSDGTAVMHLPLPDPEKEKFDLESEDVEYELVAVVDPAVAGESTFWISSPVEVYRYKGVPRNATVKGIPAARYEMHRKEIHNIVHLWDHDAFAEMERERPEHLMPHSRTFLKLFHEHGLGVNGLAPKLRPSSVENNIVINAF